MSKARFVGEAWGLETYLGRNNRESLNRPSSKEKSLIVGLFAEEVLRSALWERPLDDLKYAFYILREEKIRNLSEATVFLIRAKEWWRDLWIKEASLAPREALVLKTLREEERALPAAEMEKRYQKKLWKTESEELKARLLARETYLDQGRSASRLKRRAEQLKRYESAGFLPFSDVLAIREITKRPLAQSDFLEFENSRHATNGRDAVLREYQKALSSFAGGDPNGFVEKVEALADQYEKKDFAPALLFQAWSVAKYDLQDPVRADRFLLKLKKEYPVSDWAYPEKAPQALFQGASFRPKVARGFGKYLLPLNALRKPAQKKIKVFLSKIEMINEELAPGATREIVLDEDAAQTGFLDFFSPADQKKLRGYQVNLCEQGIRVFWGWDLGFWKVVFAARGSLEALGTRGPEPMVLRVREIRVQGVPLPREFLRQSEEDFKELLEKAGLSLQLIEAKYWKGGARVVFKKIEERWSSEAEAVSASEEQATEGASYV